MKEQIIDTRSLLPFNYTKLLEAGTGLDCTCRLFMFNKKIISVPFNG